MSDLPSVPFPAEQWSQSGLLWKINKEILHQYSLALAVTIVPASFINPERVEFSIVDGYDRFAPGVDDLKAYDFDRWLKTIHHGFAITGGTQ